jgi:SAM-dependent methyltransferase
MTDIIDFINNETVAKMEKLVQIDRLKPDMQLPINLRYDSAFLSRMFMDIRSGYEQKPLIADLGCGAGTFLIQACQEGFRGYGIDKEPELIRLAQENKSFYENLCDETIDCRFVTCDFTQEATIRSLQSMNPQVFYAYVLPTMESMVFDAIGRAAPKDAKFLWHSARKMEIAKRGFETDNWVLEKSYGHPFEEKGFLLYRKA